MSRHGGPTEMAFDPAYHYLSHEFGTGGWKNKPPKNIAIVKKRLDEEIIPKFIDVILWIRNNKPDAKIFVEYHDETKDLRPEEAKIDEWRGYVDEFLMPDEFTSMDIDLVISLGGDGTLLYVASLFKEEIVPPICAFRKGTLNFLVPFKFSDESYKIVLKNVFDGQCKFRGCVRIHCKIGDQHLTALNEIAVTRGGDPHLCKVEVLLDDVLAGRVDGDGVLLCTPTGSSAYALSAGGAILHPHASSFQVVPIAPHSISSRPIVVPMQSKVTFRISPLSRSPATVTSDGIQSLKVNPGDKLTMTMAYYQVPILHGIDKVSAPVNTWIKALNWCGKLDTKVEHENKPKEREDKPQEQGN